MYARPERPLKNKSFKADGFEVENGFLVSDGSHRTETKAVTCLGCGCLCDDLTITVKDAEVESVGVNCELGLRWFTQQRSVNGPSAWIGGKPCELGEAIERARSC